MFNTTHSSYDPVALQDMIRVRDSVFDQNDIRDVTLYLANTRYNQSVYSLAKQCGRKPARIEDTVEHIRNQLLYAFEDAGLL